MRRVLAWAALALLTLCAIYGFVHERLFQQELWMPQGLVRLAWYAAVYWAIAVLIIWLRPAWLGPLVAAFVMTYSVWWCLQFYEPWAPFAVLYFLGSCFLLGRRVARNADRMTALLLGLAIWIFAISLAIHFPINSRWVYLAAFAIPYLGVVGSGKWEGGRVWKTLVPVQQPRPTTHSPLSTTLALATLLFILLMHWLVALKPEVSSDGLAMHLAIPSIVARHARWAFDFREHTWALMPMGGDFAFTAVYLLGGEAAARLLNFAMLVAIIVMIYQTARRWLSPAPALLSCALFASTPMVQLVTGSLFVENIWAALILCAALALVRGELVIGAALFGAALSVKVGTLAFVPLAVVAAWKLPRPRRALAAALLFIVFAAPPYFNSWRKTGNPLFPFFNNVFHSPYFETNPIAAQDVRYREQFKWTTPYDVAFRSSQYFEGRNGSLGIQYFLLLLPLALLLNRRAPRTLLLIGAGGAMLTFAGQPNLRYLYPALPFLSIGIAWLISEVPRILPGWIVLIALNVWFLPASSWYHRDFAEFSEKQMEAYLNGSAPQRELVDHLNRTAPGEPVAFFKGAVLAGLNARAYSDTWHTYEYWMRLIHARAPEEIALMFTQLGIRHVIAPHPFDTEYPVVRRFLELWTVPTGVTRGNFALLNVIPLPEKVPLSPGTYDNADPRIEYIGAWTKDFQFQQAAGGSLTYSDVPGDSLRLSFLGDAITYVYTKAANRGMGEVTIDGRKRPPINLYSRQTEWQAQTVFTGLGPGTHTLEIRVLARKDPRSSSYYVDADRFVVEGKKPGARSQEPE